MYSVLNRGRTSLKSSNGIDFGLKSLLQSLRFNVFKYSVSKTTFSNNNQNKGDSKQQKGQQSKESTIQKPANNKPANKSGANTLADTIEIKHNYLKKDKDVPLEKKQELEQIARQMLKQSRMTKEDLDNYMKKAKEPLSHTPAPHVFDLIYIADYAKHLSNYNSIYETNATFQNLSKLLMHKKELSMEVDPRYQLVRKIDDNYMDSKPLSVEKNKNIDQRVNINSPDFMKKQKRISLNYNYNFEQHREYTKMFKDASAKDFAEQQNEQKLMKYMKENPKNHSVQNRHSNNIVVPIENLPDYPVNIQGFTPKVAQKSRRIREKKYNLNLTGYEAWRCWDRQIDFFNGQNHPCLTVKLSPFKLIRAFGLPLMRLTQENTGGYLFEDMNLDLFYVIDWKQTILYHGLNFSEDFYKEDVAHIHPSKRKNVYPTYEEFWNTKEDTGEFRIYFTRHSESRRFRRWLRTMTESEYEKTKDQQIPLYIDPYEDYNHKLENNYNPNILNYNAEFFLEKGEKLENPIVPRKKPVYFTEKEGEFYNFAKIAEVESQKGLKRNEEELELKKQKVNLVTDII